METGRILQEAAPVINEGLKKVFDEQGHHLTGAWEDSIHSEVSGDQIIGYANTYGSIVDAGVRPDRIPYGDTPTGAGTSKYIQGLVLFWKAKGLDDKEALSAAFATAKVQKKEGMSTWGSRDFSATKDRQHFIEEAQKEVSPKVDTMITRGLDDLINEELNEPLTLIF